MKNKKTLKVLALALAFVLVAGIAVGATMAYLTSTDSVKNVFTVGNVTIKLDETAVDLYGEEDTSATEPVKGNTYKLIPGHEYTKDPTVHVVKGSEECYVFVKVENGIADLVITEGDTIASQIAANDWIALPGVDNVYYYKNTVDATDATENIDLPVFESFTLKDTVDLSGIVSVDDTSTEADERTTITVTAYAVQADGFTSAAAAWNGAGFGGTATTPAP